MDDGGRSELYCVDCGYGVSVRVEPKWCPMCLGSEWSVRPWQRRELLDVLALDLELTRERIAREVPAR